jgi:hypothetical protein
MKNLEKLLEQISETLPTEIKKNSLHWNTTKINEKFSIKVYVNINKKFSTEKFANVTADVIVIDHGNQMIISNIRNTFFVEYKESQMSVRLSNLNEKFEIIKSAKKLIKEIALNEFLKD